MMYAQRVKNQLSLRRGEAQNLAVHILTMIHAATNAKSHMAMVMLKTSSTTKHALDSMTLTLITISRIKSIKRELLVFFAVKDKKFIQLKQLR